MTNSNSKYPFKEGDDYFTIENGEVVASVWDEVSEEIFEQNPNQVYYPTKGKAENALKTLLMNKRLKTSVLKASIKEATALAKSLQGHKMFKVVIEKDLVTIHAPLKENAGDPKKPESGNWVENDEGKIKRFLVLECKRVKDSIGTRTTLRYNPDAITIG